MRRIVIALFVLLAGLSSAPVAAACSPAETGLPAFFVVCPVDGFGLGAFAGVWTPDQTVVATGGAGYCVPADEALAGAPLEGCVGVGGAAAVCAAGTCHSAGAGAGPRVIDACEWPVGQSLVSLPPSPCLPPLLP